MTGRLRVMLITRNFPPMQGGMERLVHRAYQALSQDFDLALVGPVGAQRYVDSCAPIACCRPAPISRFLLEVQWKAARMAAKFKPDVIIGGSGLVAPAIRAAARVSGAKSICYVHGLDLVVRSLLFRTLFIPAIARCDILLANSRNTASLAEAAGVKKEKLKIVYPGADGPLVDLITARGRFRHKLAVGDEVPLLLSVGRLTRRKGIIEFIERALPNLVRRLPALKLLIVGAEPTQALKKDNISSQDVLEMAHRLGLEENVVLLGQVDDETLSTAYAASDLLIFPVLPMVGDVEGFGMVAIEAAAHGVPTVAFAVGGVCDSVKDGVSGRLVEPLNYSEMERVIVEYLSCEREFDWFSSCLCFGSMFSWDRFGQRLREACIDAALRSPTAT